MFFQLKKLLIKYRCSLFRGSFFLLFFMPFIIFSIVFFLITLSSSIVSYDDFIVAINFVIIFMALFFFIWISLYLMQCRPLIKFGKDRRKQAYKTVDCQLIYSEQMFPRRFFNVLNKILGIIYLSQRASFHKCYFQIGDDEHSRDYFYYILTEERKDLFSKLFKSKESYSYIGYQTKKITFDSSLPVRITFGESSHVLQSFTYQTHVQYTDEQLRLIKRINGEGFWKKGKVRKRTNLEKVYCNIFVSTAILFFESFILSIFLYDVVYCIIFLVKNFPFSLYYALMIIGGFLLLLFIGALTLIGWEMAKNPKECSDILFSWKKREMNSAVVTLLSGDSFLMANNAGICFDYIFPEEHPMIMKLFYRRLDDEVTPRMGSDCYVNWIATNSKINMLGYLYECKNVMRYNPTPDERPISPEPTFEQDKANAFVNRSDESSVRRGLQFNKNVPLYILFAKNGRELISIAPVEGYEYTESQLAAIEKFNTLYP